MSNEGNEHSHGGIMSAVRDFLKSEDMFASGIQLRMNRKVKKNPK